MKNNIILFIIFVLVSASSLQGQLFNLARGINFDGNDDYVDLGNSSNLKPASALTVECWASADDWTPDSKQKFISNTQYGGYSLGLYDDNTIIFHVRIGSQYFYARTSTVSLASGWHHIAGAFDGRYITLYVDGKKVDTRDLGSYGHVISYSTANSTLLAGEATSGSTPDNWGAYKGKLDEVRIWNKSRGKIEIERSYQVEIPSDAEGLVAYYKMDGYGTVLYDNSINSHNGTLHNGAARQSIEALIVKMPQKTGDYYSIRIKNDLKWLSNCPDAWDSNFRQSYDINFVASDFEPGGDFYNEGNGFLPIGVNSTYPFTGSYDGINNYIDGLTITGQSAQGFFGYISGAVIRKLDLSNVKVIASSDLVGGVIGKSSDSEIENCYSTGTVSGRSKVGGLVGDAYRTTISNSSSSCVIEGAYYTGGLVGFLNSSSVSNSYSVGSVTRESSSNSAYIGSFCGVISAGAIEKSYSAGTVNCGDADNKGFVGHEINPAGYSNNFFDTEATGQSTGLGATGKTTSEMTDFMTYVDENQEGLTSAWDFLGNYFDDAGTSEIWDMDQEGTANNGYPIFRYQEGADYRLFKADFEGYGNSGSPYLIASLDDLKKLSEKPYYWQSYIKQTADINASETVNWNNGKGFIPIGNETYPFEGEYDGNQHIIEGLTINRPSESNIGFLGYAAKGVRVEYLWLKDVSINGDTNVGGMVGYYNPDTSLAEILYSAVTGNIKGSENTGAFTGNFILDYIQGEPSQITNSFSIGSVTRKSGAAGTNFGGFCGNTDAAFSYCYAAVEVNDENGTPWPSGDKGFIGNDNSGSYSNLFFDKTVSGQNSDAGAFARTTSEMKTKSTYVDSSWQFIGSNDPVENFHWGLNPDENGGYPFMNWQPFKDENSYVFTFEATEVEHYSATLNGKLEYIGSSPILTHGFCYGTGSMPTLEDNYVDLGAISATGEVSHKVENLYASTDYYFRAYVTTELGTNYSDLAVSFATKDSLVGSGTDDRPYEITNLTDLHRVASNSRFWGNNFVLTADIDAQDSSIIIGNNTIPFTGKFDGNGYTISNVKLRNFEKDNYGFFGKIKDAHITNLNINNLFIECNNYSGGLVGHSNNSTITNCSTTGILYSYGNNVGGLVGYSDSTVVDSCYSTVTVKAWKSFYSSFEGRNLYFFGVYVGGLIGRNSYSTVKNSYSTGNVAGGIYTGGLVGYNENSVIRNSYYKGNVHSKGGSFGNVGEMQGAFCGANKYSTIENSYSAGICFKESIPTNAFIGVETSSITFDNFFDSQTSQQNSANGATAKTTTQMKTTNTFTDAGWDFTGESVNGTDDPWTKTSLFNEGYPLLSWQKFYDTPVSLTGITNLPYILHNMNIGFKAENQGDNITLDVKEMRRKPLNMPAGSRTIGKYWEVNNIDGGKVKLTLYYHPSRTANFEGTPAIYHYNGTKWELLPTTEAENKGILKAVTTQEFYGSFSPVTIGDSHSPLPVELTTFRVEKVNGEIKITWETATEVDNYGFEIERKSVNEDEQDTPGKWQTLGFVKGAGNSNSPKDYVYTDKTVPDGVVEYRLKQIDSDGSYSYSETVEINNSIVPREFSLSQNYPNPFNPSTTIEFALPVKSGVTISLFNILGEKIMELVSREYNAGIHKMEFNATDLSSGIYFYNIEATGKDGNNFMKTRKMVLLK